MGKLLKTAAWLVFLIPGIYLWILWDSMPPQVPLHYDLQGNVDRIGDKSELIIVVLIITAINIGVFLLMVNAHRFSPKRQAADNSDRMLRMAYSISIFISAILCVILYSSANGISEFLSGLILSFVGLLLSVMGNYMYNIKPNYVAGFRMPWTLSNDENWRKTHKLGGIVWFIGGMVIAIVCPFISFQAGIVFFTAVMITMTLVPLIYSYRLHKHQKASH